jgi:hypothetical protein
MENLENEVTEVADVGNVPPTDESNETHEEQELTDDELTEEVARLKEEAKAVDDPKEKRHLEQQAGRLQQLSKAREKASQVEQSLRDKESRLAELESREIDYVYRETQGENGLQYFENLMEENRDLAEKVAHEKYGMSAKKLIQATYKNLADGGDDKSKEKVTESESEAKAEHKLAIKYATKTFSDLSTEEKEVANKYFDRIA